MQGKTQVRQRRVTKAEKRQQRFEAEEFARPEREEIFEIPLQGMSLQELADRLATGQGEIIASLFRRGIMVQVGIPPPLQCTSQIHCTAPHSISCLTVWPLGRAK